MTRRVKTVSDMVERDREEMHSWVLRDVRAHDDHTVRHWTCHCGASQTRETRTGEDISRRVYYRVGGDGHG